MVKRREWCHINRIWKAAPNNKKNSTQRTQGNNFSIENYEENNKQGQKMRNWISYDLMEYEFWRSKI